MQLPALLSHTLSGRRPRVVYHTTQLGSDNRHYKAAISHETLRCPFSGAARSLATSSWTLPGKHWSEHGWELFIPEQSQSSWVIQVTVDTVRIQSYDCK